MDVRNESVKVAILGTEYSIKTDVDASITKEIAQYVDLKMGNIRKNSCLNDHMKIAVLTSLNLGGEIFELREKCNQLESTIRELSKRINSLSERINSFLSQ